MNAVMTIAPPVRGQSVIVEDVAALERIFQPEHNLVVWRRSGVALSDAEFAPWLAHPRRFLREFAIDECCAAGLAAACNLAAESALATDLAALAELFITVTDATHIGLRVEITDTRTCPRFHVDNVALRMLCTYRGPATEWVDSANVDRRLLGLGAKGLTDASSGLLRSPEVVRTMQRYDVALMKGERWPQNTGYGAVHRSPAVPAGTLRVLVSFDSL